MKHRERLARPKQYTNADIDAKTPEHRHEMQFRIVKKASSIKNSKWVSSPDKKSSKIGNVEPQSAKLSRPDVSELPRAPTADNLTSLTNSNAMKADVSPSTAIGTYSPYKNAMMFASNSHEMRQNVEKIV